MNLKTILLSFLITFSIGANALKSLEIQCDTEFSKYDFVIKRSPDTQVTYALLFTTDQLETYLALEEVNILEESNDQFHYLKIEDGDLIKIDLTSGEGNFSLKWDQFDQKYIQLKQCKSTITLPNGP